jgi:hypothetical protein
MDAWNLKVSDDQLEQLNLRAKYRMSQLQLVLTHTYQRKSVSEIARLLNVTRNVVIWMQHVLQLRDGKAWKSGQPRLGKWPRRPVSEADAA